MNSDFWKNRWANNEIGFHLAEAHEWLVQYLDKLALPKGSRIFLPLCGKTLDIHWLLQQGYQVAGCELVELAIQQLFEELRISPAITQHGNITRYSAPDIDMYVGDIFELTPDLLGPVAAVYDRAALIALPKDLRILYTRHVMQITGRAPQLLICFEYDPALYQGPPFSVTADELREHYANYYTLRLLDSEQTPDGLKGQYPALESAWSLQKSF